MKSTTRAALNSSTVGEERKKRIEFFRRWSGPSDRPPLNDVILRIYQDTGSIQVDTISNLLRDYVGCKGEDCRPPRTFVRQVIYGSTVTST
jgi:hypothetical protein